jgi:hypothetical protein
MNLIDVLAIGDLRNQIAARAGIAAPLMFTCKTAFAMSFPCVSRIRADDATTLIFQISTGEIAVTQGICRHNAELGSFDTQYRPGIYAAGNRASASYSRGHLYRYPSHCDDSAAIYSIFDDVIRLYQIPYDEDGADRCMYYGRDTHHIWWKPSHMLAAAGMISDTHHRVTIYMYKDSYEKRCPHASPSTKLGEFRPSVVFPCTIALGDSAEIIGEGAYSIATNLRILPCTAPPDVLVARWPDLARFVYGVTYYKK